MNDGYYVYHEYNVYDGYYKFMPNMSTMHSVGGFISKSTGKKCEDKKASRRSEEVKNQVDPLSKFNICWVKIQLFSQSWESFQTRMRTGFS